MYMFRLIFILTFLFAHLISASEISHEQRQKIRNNYYAGVENEERVEVLENFLRENFNQSDLPALAIAYLGGVDALKSKHSFWPLKKYNFLLSALEKLDRAVQKDPHSTEIRFVRFSILHYVPDFLGYMDLKREDAGVIVENLERASDRDSDYQLLKNIAKFMIESERISDPEINALRIRFNLAS